MRITTMKKYILSLAAVAMATTAMASDYIHASAGLETSHLWRGIEVSSGLTYNADLSFSDKNDHFRVGLWGGGMFNGDYKEFDYYMSYTNKGFTASVWDIYNFSDAAPGNHKIFNYKVNETSHFIDAGVAYNFGATTKVPLTLSWNTVIAGRDRGVTGKKNLYSTFINAAVTAYDSEKWNVTPSVGASFALSPEDGIDGNFYSADHNFSVVDVRLNVTYKLKIKNYPLPITVGGMWNPDANKGYFRAAVTLVNL